MYRVPFALSLPSRVTQGTLVTAVKMQHHMCDVYAQGSPLETQHLHMHRFFLEHTKTPDPYFFEQLNYICFEIHMVLPATVLGMEVSLNVTADSLP